MKAKIKKILSILVYLDNGYLPELKYQLFIDLINN